MSEFGIFSDDGLLEGGFYSEEHAERIRERDYDEDDAHVAECCHDHPEHERATCECCDVDDEPAERDMSDEE